jgi:histidinol-phosphate aminotransferase
VLVLRTFSKIFGLAGLRVGYGIGPRDVITAIGKVRRAFDVTSVGQEAALASIDDHAEIAQRRDANKVALAELRRVLAAHGFEAARPAAANLFVRWRRRGAERALLRHGVIVAPWDVRSSGRTPGHGGDARRGRLPRRGPRRAPGAPRRLAALRLRGAS